MDDRWVCETLELSSEDAERYERMVFLAGVVRSKCLEHEDLGRRESCVCSVELRGTTQLCPYCAMRQLAQMVGYALAMQWLEVSRKSQRIIDTMQASVTV